MKKELVFLRTFALATAIGTLVLATTAFKKSGNQKFTEIDVERINIVEKDGTVVFNFGKYEGKPAGEVLYNDRNYYNWIITKEFSSQVKQAVKSLLKDYANKMDKDKR